MPFSHDSNSQSKCIYLKCKVQKNTIDNYCCSQKDNYTISTIHYALFGVYCHSTVLGKKGKTTRDVYGAHVQPARVTGRRDKQMRNNKLLLNKRETSTGHQNPLQIFLQLLINILGAARCRRHNGRLHQASIYYVQGSQTKVGVQKKN